MSQSIMLDVNGMKCGGCESNVTGKLKELGGVSSVTASNKENTVSIEFDESKTSLDEIKQTIASAGFEVVD